MVTVYRYSITKDSPIFKRGVKGEQYLYTTTHNHPDISNEEYGVPLDGYSWEFDSNRGANKFLRGISERTIRHTVEVCSIN